MIERDILRALAVLVGLGAASCGDEPEAASASTGGAAGTTPRLDGGLEVFQGPLPRRFDSEANPLTHEKVNLGRMLYYDERLSVSGTISCNSCHPLQRYGADGEVTSPGHDGTRGARNSPTTLNAAAHFAQFWDGRAADVEEQAKAPVLNPIEMGMPSAEAVLEVLRAVPGYVAAFARAFPGDAEPITYDNFGRAIGAFERGLAVQSRFDQFLGGDEKALNAAERRGLATFMQVGCTACHAGPALGGQMFQKLGLVAEWPNQKDQGRFDLTGDEADRMFFKVPSLRNVAETAPYFHDGSAPALEQAVSLMGRHQLGVELTPEQIRSIAVFLKSLTGELPAQYIKKPEMP